MAEEGENEVRFFTTTEPLRETEDISMILYRRAKEQEALLSATRKRETQTREAIGKAKRRKEVATKEIGKILPKKAALLHQITLKEAKLKEIGERIEIVQRFKENCKLYLERGNVAERKIRETKDTINEVGTSELFIDVNTVMLCCSISDTACTASSDGWLR